MKPSVLMLLLCKCESLERAEDAYMFGVNPDGTVNCRIDQNTQATYDGEDFAG